MVETDFFSTETISVPIGSAIVPDCSIFSIVNNRKNIRLSGTVALNEPTVATYLYDGP